MTVTLDDLLAGRAPVPASGGSLAAALSASPAPVLRERPDPPELVDWDGTSGSIAWSAPATAKQPKTYDDILRKLNFDPDDVMVKGSPRAWSVIGKDGERRINYWAEIIAREAMIDTPVLDALIQRHRPLRRVPGTGPKRAVVVAFADPQIGKVDWRGGTDELVARIGQTYDLLEAHLREVRPDLIVWGDLGDIVEGIDSGGGPLSQATTNDLSLPSQIEVAAQIEHVGIALCARHAAEVIVAGVGSNHCRWRAGKSNLGTPQDDYGLMILRILRARYEDHPDLQHVRFALPQGFDEHVLVDVLGTRVGIVHGHQARNPDKIGDWWAKQAHGGSSLSDADILLVGHFHNYRTQPSGRSAHTGREKRWHIAPTLDNGSSWFRNGSGGSDSDPGLLVLTVEEGIGVTETRVLRPGGWQ